MTNVLDVTIDPQNHRGWPKTARQLEWAHFHIMDALPAHDAALRAGYSASTAKAKSHLLHRRLQPFLSHLQARKNDAIRAQFQVTTEKLTYAFATIALSNVSDYYRPVQLKNGARRLVGKPLDELTPEQAFAVKSWTIVERDGQVGTIVDYQYVFYDRMKALHALAKHMGLFNQQLQIRIRDENASRTDVDLSRVPSDVLHEAIETLNGVNRKIRLSSVGPPESDEQDTQ
jgi:Terminase small subunit